LGFAALDGCLAACAASGDSRLARLNPRRLSMLDSRFPTHSLAHALPRGAQPLPHERLDAFRIAVELVELAAAVKPQRGAAGAVDQLRRAATSVALNISEACGRDGADRRRFFAMARGSALESAAALRVLLALRAVSADVHRHGRTLCERLYAMLTKLAGFGR
jgi:four helix bundle protein